MAIRSDSFARFLHGAGERPRRAPTATPAQQTPPRRGSGRQHGSGRPAWASTQFQPEAEDVRAGGSTEPGATALACRPASGWRRQARVGPRRSRCRSTRGSTALRRPRGRWTETGELGSELRHRAQRSPATRYLQTCTRFPHDVDAAVRLHHNSASDCGGTSGTSSEERASPSDRVRGRRRSSTY